MQLEIGSYTVTSAAGIGLAELSESIAARRTGLRRNDLEACDLDTWIGRVEGVESVALPDNLEHLHSRNNQLAWLGLKQDNFLEYVDDLKLRIGVDRIGVNLHTRRKPVDEGQHSLAVGLPCGGVV